MTIIDSHTHMPSPGWDKRKDYFPSVLEAVRYLRNEGVDRAVFTPWQGVLNEGPRDVEIANREALESAALTEGFLYPGVSMSPECPAESVRWLKTFHEQGYRWAGELVIKQLKNPCTYIDAPCTYLFEHCADMGFIVQLHGMREIVPLAEKFPRLKIVCSHICEDEFMKQLAQYPNVLQDISGKAGGLIMGRLEAAVEIFTPDRLLFGTDFTGYEPQPFITRVKKVIPDVREQNKVFSGNILALLDSVGSRPIL